MSALPPTAMARFFGWRPRIFARHWSSDGAEPLERHPALRHALRGDDWQAHFYPDVTAGGVGDVPAPELDRPRCAELVGDNGGGERAVAQPRPEPRAILLVLAHHV